MKISFLPFDIPTSNRKSIFPILIIHKVLVSILIIHKVLVSIFKKASFFEKISVKKASFFDLSGLKFLNNWSGVPLLLAFYR